MWPDVDSQRKIVRMNCSDRMMIAGRLKQPSLKIAGSLGVKPAARAREKATPSVSDHHRADDPTARPGPADRAQRPGRGSAYKVRAAWLRKCPIVGLTQERDQVTSAVRPNTDRPRHRPPNRDLGVQVRTRIVQVGCQTGPSLGWAGTNTTAASETLTEPAGGSGRRRLAGMTGTM
jgi:hypothetical protein